MSISKAEFEITNPEHLPAKAHPTGKQLLYFRYGVPDEIPEFDRASREVPPDGRGFEPDPKQYKARARCMSMIMVLMQCAIDDGVIKEPRLENYVTGFINRYSGSEFKDRDPVAADIKRMNRVTDRVLTAIACSV